MRMRVFCAQLVRSRADRAAPGVVSIAAGWYEQDAPLLFGQADGGATASAASPLSDANAYLCPGVPHLSCMAPALCDTITQKRGNIIKMLPRMLDSHGMTH